MTTTDTKSANTETRQVSFGNGRYSAEMANIYVGLQERFNIEPLKAERIARQAGSDAGAALAATHASFRVAKPSGKDMMTTISDASKAKGIRMTNALSLVHALQWIADAGKHGIRYQQTFRLAESLQTWIDEMVIEPVEK